MDSIKWYESKVVWLNVATAMLLIAALFLPGGEFSNLLSESVRTYVAIGVAVVNIILRVGTNRQIG